MMVGFIAGCGAGTGAAGNTANQTTGAAAGEPTLIMATSADYKPYEFHDTSSGQDKIVGFDIDVADAIAKKLHFQYKIQDMDFNGLIGSLQSHRADFVIAGMSPTEERKKSVDFSDMYYEARMTIVSKKGSPYTTLDSLKGKRVGAQLGSIQEAEAKKIPGATVDSLNTIPAIVQQVITGRDDAAIIEDTVATGYVKQNPQLQMTYIPNLAANGSAIAFPKGSPWVDKFNQAIREMKQDGELDKLEQKWFGSGQTQG
ncbi:MAG: transporter substrate-binding domain-containing protein [Alicyclobacillus sp.]|nr:transporter substrate-binding domain-containing protein [Alicyclobacillus sp.]